MGIEPLRLSLRTESKITLGATSQSKWLIAFKWQCFNVHNVLGIFQSFSIAKHHIRKPKKSIWEKIEDRIFPCESSVQTSIHSIHCGFVWGRQETLVLWVSISFQIPIWWINESNKEGKEKKVETNVWLKGTSIFFIFDFHNFFTLSKRCDKKCPKTFKYVFFFIIFWVFLHNWVFFFKHEIHQFVWHICLR